MFKVSFDRSKFDKRYIRTKRHQHCVEVHSHIQLDTEENGVKEYQIGCIICHQYKLSSTKGHYVTYIRSGKQWWLYNDSKVSSIDCINEAVNGREVVTCYYVLIDKVNEPLEVGVIGTDQAKARTRSAKRAKLS